MKVLFFVRHYSYLRLFDSKGRELHANDDAAAPGESAGFDSYLEYVFATAGTYYIGVSGVSNASYSATDGSGDFPGSTGGFTLRLFAVS